MTTAAEQFSPEYLNYDKGPPIVRTAIVIGAIALVVIILRLWGRKMKGLAWGWDDWIMIVCIPFLIGTAICTVMAVYSGRVGRHLAVNLVEDRDSLGRSFACLFAVECVYGTLLALVKASILCMYSRIFPTQFVTRGCYVLGAMVAIWYIAVLLVTFLQCRPIYKIWSPFMTEGSCIDNNKFFIGNAVPNIVTDLCILVLPVYEVVRLHLRTAQKLALCAIFLLGGFVPIVSLVRLFYLFRLSAGGSEADVTVLIAIPWILTCVEGEVAVICACLPTMQPIAQLAFGRWFPKSSQRPSAQNDFNVVTIGGGSLKPTKRSSLSRVMGNNGTGSFEQLNDSESAQDDTAGLWPNGYKQQRRIVVRADRDPSEGSVEIPLESITVRRDVTWAESKSTD